MPHIEVKSAEDLIEGITFFLTTAPPFERAKLAAFFDGFTKAQDEATKKEEEDDHDDRSRS